MVENLRFRVWSLSCQLATAGISRAQGRGCKVEASKVFTACFSKVSDLRMHENSSCTAKAKTKDSKTINSNDSSKPIPVSVLELYAVV